MRVRIIVARMHEVERTWRLCMKNLHDRGCLRSWPAWVVQIKDRPVCGYLNYRPDYDSNQSKPSKMVLAWREAFDCGCLALIARARWFLILFISPCWRFDRWSFVWFAFLPEKRLGDKNWLPMSVGFCFTVAFVKPPVPSKCGWITTLGNTKFKQLARFLSFLDDTIRLPWCSRDTSMHIYTHSFVQCWSILHDGLPAPPINFSMRGWARKGAL